MAIQNQQLGSQVQHLSVLNKKYEHELALFKRHKFGQKNEHLSAKQIDLFDEAIEEDIEALDLELEKINTDAHKTKKQPKRQALPNHLQVIRIEHEPTSTPGMCHT